MKKRVTSLILLLVLALFAAGCENALESNVANSPAEPSERAIGASAVRAGTMQDFPQNRDWGFFGTRPSFSAYAEGDPKLNSDIVALYNDWKDAYVRELSFTNGDEDDSFDAYIIVGEANGEVDGFGDSSAVSTSEAHGYGMIIFALMANDSRDTKPYFDSMYKLYRNLNCKDEEDLMSWAIPYDGEVTTNANGVIDPDMDFDATTDLDGSSRQSSATDGDMDVAYALLLANDQWGGKPDGYDFSYYDAAIEVIEGLEVNNIFDETGPHFPRLGVGDHSPRYEDVYATRPSDFMLSHMQIFHDVTGDSIWSRLRNSTEKIVVDVLAELDGDFVPMPGNFPEGPGLLPDFMGNKNGVTSNDIQIFEGISDEPSEEGTPPEAVGSYDDDFFYNACRYPFRAALYAMHYGGYSQWLHSLRFTSWVSSSHSSPSNVKAGYHLDGSVHQHEDMPNWTSPWYDEVFVSPMMTSFSLAGDHSTAGVYWEAINDFNASDAWTSHYYDNSINLLNMLLVSGNWWPPTVGEKAAPPTGGPYPWEVGASYVVGDEVSHGGETWVCTMAHTAHSPTWYPGAPGVYLWRVK